MKSPIFFSKGRTIRFSIQIVLVLALVRIAFVPSALYANPIGEQVVGGAAGFNRPDTATLVVNQNTDRAVINWNSFSIANGELTRFVQPSSTSAVLNRVVTANPSAIYGTLQANGAVYLINPGGVLVGAGGVVNTASFVASTHDISTEEFMKGGQLNFKGNSDASVINQGSITAREGDVFLIAKEVRNEGQLMAKDGTVGMVSGTEVSLQAVGQGKFKVRLLAAENDPTSPRTSEREDSASKASAEIVNEGVINAANAVLEATGSYLPMAIKNTGVIQATGMVQNGDGSVTLTGGEGDILNTGVVAALQKNAAGVQRGGTIVVSAKNITTDPGSIMTASGSEKGGEIKFSASDTIYAGGKVQAKSEEGKGGKIQLTGERVGLFQAEVDASGKTGGGAVLVGGDYQGKNPEVPNAKAVLVTSDSVIRANATGNGDGGKVILWSDEYTGFYGQIFARAGLLGGDGGFVETSSHDNLQAWGEVDTFSPLGRSGNWLLDPTELYITTTTSNIDPTVLQAGAPNGPWTYQPTTLSTGVSQSQANANTILQALDAGQNVTIQVNTATGSSRTVGNIYVARDLVVQSGTLGMTRGDLTLLAGGATGSYNAAGNPTTGAGVTGGSGGGSIFVNSQIYIGGNLKMIAGNDPGLTQTVNGVTTVTGGIGGNITISAPITSLNGVVTLQAGWATAADGGGTGGSIRINSAVTTSGGNGKVVINAGAANTSGTGGTGTGGVVTVNSTITLGTSVTGVDPITTYRGSVIAAGNASGRGGNLTLNSPINGNGATVTLQSGAGSGGNPGTFTLASGAVVGEGNSTSTRLLQVTIRSQTSLGISAGIYANNIILASTPIPTSTGPSNNGSIWINENAVTGLNSFNIGNTAIGNLFANLLPTDKIQIGDDTFNGDIAIGQAGGVTFSSSNLTFVGSNAQPDLTRSISFNASSGTCLTLSGSGTLTFDTGGSLFTRFGTAPLDIAAGTIDFKRVAAPSGAPAVIGQSASQPLKLNAVNILSSGTLVGNVFISNVSGLNFSGDFNMGTGSLNLVTGGNITQTAGTITARGANNVFNASGNDVNLRFLNNFGTVAFSSVKNAIIGDVNAIVLAASTLTGGLTVNAGGNITQSGALTVAGTSSFATTAGPINLSALNDFTGAVSLSTTGDNAISIRDQNSMVLGNLSTAAGSATVTIVTGGNLTQQSGTSITSLGTGDFTLQATASGTSINLATYSDGSPILNNIASANVVLTGGANFQDFGLSNTSSAADSPSATTALSLRNLTLIFKNNAITMPAANFNTLSGNLVLTAGGAITQLGALTVAGASTITTTAGAITLTLANDFQGAVTLTGSGTGAISITDRSSLILGGLTQAGNGAVTIAVGTGTATGATAALTQTGLITTGTGSSAGGAFTITASPTSGSFTTIDLSTSDNLIRTGSLTVDNSSQVKSYSLRNIYALADSDAGLTAAGFTNLQNLAIYYGTLAGAGTASLNLPAFTLLNGGSLTLLGTAVTQSGAWTVNGSSSTSTITATAGAITLTEANDFQGAVSLITPSNAVITDKNALTLGTLSIGGSLTANSTGALNLGLGSVGGNLTANSRGGAITQTGALTINGTSSITAGAATITLTQALNNFIGAVSLSNSGNNDVRITDANALTLGTLSVGATGSGGLFATSTGGLNLGSGTVTGVLSATSNGGNITQTSGLSMGGASFNAGAGDVTMTAGVDAGVPSNVYSGNVSITANNADFLMSVANGINRLGQTAGSVVVAGAFTLRSPSGSTFNLANGAGGFELTTSQLNNFTVGTLAPTASGVGNIRIGTFNFSGVRNLSLTTTGTGSISANGAITTQTLSMNSGGAATFDVPNRIQNLGQTRVTTGGLSLQNARGMNLTGTVTLLNGGSANLTVAGQFYNNTGLESPFAGTTGRAVVRSLSLMGGLPNQVSALAGFTPSYNFTDPGSSRAMIYAVTPLAQFAPGGTVIAGVDLSGTETGGGQFNTFLTGSDNLNWMISDFGRFEMPTVRPSGMNYILYPQRVEPETSTLPAATLSQLERELGRPPTLDEIQAREVAVRKEASLQNRPILERSSFDAGEDELELDKQESAEVPAQVIDGGKPQAGGPSVAPSPLSGGALEGFGPQAKSEIQDVDPKTTDNSGRSTPKFRALTPKPILRGGPKSAVATLDSSEPSLNGSAIEVSAQELNLDTQSVMEQERVSAEVGIAPPIAGK